MSDEVEHHDGALFVAPEGWRAMYQRAGKTWYLPLVGWYSKPTPAGTGFYAAVCFEASVAWVYDVKGFSGVLGPGQDIASLSGGPL